jgi:hypothetical protein
MTPVAYVSDEMYVALANVSGEFESVDTGEITVLRSSPRGAFYGPLTSGRYRVTLAKDGYGSKTVTVELGSGTAYQFRLLSDTLLGYIWPKWVRAGDQAEFRAHSPEQYQLT